MTIYLDNSTTTRPSEKAIQAMMPFLTQKWGSPSAPHQKGQELFPAMEVAYRSLYTLLGAKESDGFVFTSSGAEAVNHAIFSAYYDVSRTSGKNHFITAKSEEAPALMAISRLEALGCVSKTVSTVTAQAFADAITPRTAMISISFANGLTGVIHPVSEIAALCKERGILLHVDATHVLGKLFFDLADVQADFITFNGDQLHAPKGTGGLYIKNGRKCSPFIIGGLEQGGMRAGTLNVPGLVALGEAAKELLDQRDLLCTEVARLRDKFERGLKDIGTPLFQEQERLPNVSCIAFANIANESLLYALSRKGLFATIGGGNFQLLEDNTAISFSLSRETTESEIDRAIALIKETTLRLRKLCNF